VHETLHTQLSTRSVCVSVCHGIALQDDAFFSPKKHINMKSARFKVLNILEIADNSL